MEDSELHETVAKIMEDESVISVTVHYPDGGVIFSRPLAGREAGDAQFALGKGKPSPEKVCFPVGSPHC